MNQNKSSQSVMRSLKNGNNVNKVNNNKANNKSFWKKWSKHNHKKESSENKNIKKEQKQKEESSENAEYGNYMEQELCLIAEKAKIATIWIYGLERLVQANKKNEILNLSSSQFKISIKELMNYRNKGNKEIIDSTPFKMELDKIHNAFYNIIDSLPQSLFEEEMPSYLARKIRQDQNEIDYIMHQVTKARFDEYKLKRWSIILKRIEVNIGGYRIALNNKKHFYQISESPFSQNQADQLSHKRRRSQSSSIYSQNYQNKLNILKNRSPRSPQNAFDHKMERDDVLAINQMERYDSI